MNASKIDRCKSGAHKVAYQTRPGPAVLDVPSNVIVDNTSPETVKKSANSGDSKSKVFSLCKNLHKKLGLKHFALMVITVVYAMFGGWLFSFLELDNELQTKSEKRDNLTRSANEIASDITELFFASNNFSRDEIRDAITARIREYQKNQSMIPDDKIMWDFWGGMFFAGTVFTTIGYGHYCPATTSGRVAVMIYALIGIPMVLAMLSDFGRALTKVLNKLWSYFRNGMSKLTRCLLHKEFVINVQGVDSFDFPIPLAIGLIVSWIFACAAFFRIWEEKWSYFDAFYFFFISLSTIGLGDITPEHPKFMICNFPLVIIGLSLVSLVINLIQNKLEKLKEKTAGFVENKFGLDGGSAESDDNTSSSDKGDETSPVADNRHAEKNQKITLGILQTFKKAKRKRKRTGMQTDESFIRDSYDKRKEINSVQKDPVFSTFGCRKFKNYFSAPDCDDKSVELLETVFYDAQ